MAHNEILLFNTSRYLTFADRYCEVISTDLTHQLKCVGYILWHAMLLDEGGLLLYKKERYMPRKTNMAH